MIKCSYLRLAKVRPLYILILFSDFTRVLQIFLQKLLKISLIMNLSKKFEELILKQLESFGCSMGVTHLVIYLASAKQGTKANLKMIGF